MESISITRASLHDASPLKSAGYDAINQVLEIEFVPRSQGTLETNVVRYEKVPQAIRDAFYAATDKKAYYETNIQGKYPNNHPHRY